MKSYEKLAHLVKDFSFAASTYGKVIISEYHLPTHQKTIKPDNAGGVVGGVKYIVHDIFVCFFYRFLLSFIFFYSSFIILIFLFILIIYSLFILLFVICYIYLLYLFIYLFIYLLLIKIIIININKKLIIIKTKVQVCNRQRNDKIWRR